MRKTGFACSPAEAQTLSSQSQSATFHLFNQSLMVLDANSPAALFSAPVNAGEITECSARLNTLFRG